MAPESACRVGRRTLLVELVAEKGMSVTEAAAVTGMSRQCAHKWLERAKAHGVERGLKDESRARKTQRRFEGAAVEMLLALRRLHRTWGSKHLLAQLRKREPRLALPSASTLTELMREEGLLEKRVRYRRHEPIFRQRRATGPNDIWTIDFKGQFRLGDGQMCYPLTIRDAFSRKVLRVVGCTNTRHEAVLKTLASAFAEFGLPRMLHSDTGAPFGSTGLGRLSQVSLYVMQLGIQPTFSRPGKPQDNGGHERMHWDLKQETAMPSARTMASQQARFDAFIECFNTERMHQALQMKTPDSVWCPAARRLPSTLRETQYEASWETRSIDVSGRMPWRGGNVFIASALRGKRIGLEPLDDGMWRLHFAAQPIAFLCETATSTRIEDLQAS